MNWDLLIFDCDGVLVDSEPIGNKVIAEELARLGIEIPFDEIVDKFVGGYLDDSLKAVEEMSGIKIPLDEFVPRYRQRSFERFKQELQPVAGIPDIVQKLRKPFCVASNGPRNKIELNLSITKLLPFFKGKIYSAYELDTWKPDPAFYLTVSRQMGVTPEKCVVIEDSHYGVKSAVDAGIRVFGYTAGKSQKRIELENAGAIPLDHMNELVNLLDL